MCFMQPSSRHSCLFVFASSILSFLKQQRNGGKKNQRHTLQITQSIQLNDITRLKASPCLWKLMPAGLLYQRSNERMYVFVCVFVSPSLRLCITNFKWMNERPEYQILSGNITIFSGIGIHSYNNVLHTIDVELGRCGSCVFVLCVPHTRCRRAVALPGWAGETRDNECERV